MTTMNGTIPTLNPMFKFISNKEITKLPKYLNPNSTMDKDKVVNRNLISMISLVIFL